ncbi:MAG: ParA family protein [Nautiliaceae bacterium]
MIISLYNIKGGVGKSSTSVNLASLARKEGKTLLIDLDSQGASSYFFNKKPKKRYIFTKPIEKTIKKTQYKNLDIIPADITLKESSKLPQLLNILNKNYKFVIIDSPATLNELTQKILISSDIVIVPILPNILSLRTYNQLIKTKLNKNIRLFLNRVENKPLHKQVIKAVLKLPSSQYLKTYIPKSDLIEAMPFSKMSIIEQYPNAKEAKIYKKLFEEIKTLF